MTRKKKKADPLDKFNEAVKAKLPVWAIVLRSQTVKMVRGSTVKPGELLAWTVEGASEWCRVATVVNRIYGT